MIGAQLYTLREYTKTPADIAKTLARVKKIGYNSVQASALGPIDAAELGKILKDNDLLCAATHTAQEKLEKETQKVIDDHALWGCKFTAIGGFWAKEYTAQTWVDFANQYNAIAKKFAGSGLSIGYHNHSHEFVHFDGKPALQILMEHFDPAIWFEIDTYWVTHGGGDPVNWIGRCGQLGKGRIPCVHMKDMAVKATRPVEQYMAEVGEGNLNWSGILSACKSSGTQYLLVEQDICYRDPFDSLETSLKNLQAMGVG